MTWQLFEDWLYLTGVAVSTAVLVYGAGMAFWWYFWEGGADDDTVRDQPGREASPACPQPSSRAKADKRTDRRVAAVLVAALLLPIGAFFGSAKLAFAGDPFDRGVDAYRHSRYAEAAAQFRVAAESGHTRAQEALGFMYLHGSGLYGGDVPYDREQAIQWFGRAAQGGSEVGLHMLCSLKGRPADTVIDRSSCASLRADRVDQAAPSHALRQGRWVR